MVTIVGTLIVNGALALTSLLSSSSSEVCKEYRNYSGYGYGNDGYGHQHEKCDWYQETKSDDCIKNDDGTVMLVCSPDDKDCIKNGHERYDSCRTRVAEVARFCRKVEGLKCDARSAIESLL
jgi:hypothetical protein